MADIVRSGTVISGSAESAIRRVELCFTPTCSSCAKPIKCNFKPLRDFVLNNSDHP